MTGDSSSSPLIEQRAGSTLRTVVQLPQAYSDALGLSYDSYVRVSLGLSTDSNGIPRFAFYPLDADWGPRGNDFKVSSNAYIPLPRRLVRAFGIRDAISWVDCQTQLVGELSAYNDQAALYQLLNEITAQTIPTQTPADGAESPTTTFSLLERIATERYLGTDAFAISEASRGRIRSHIPTSFGESHSEAYFVLFCDGESFLTVLIPSTIDNPLLSRIPTATAYSADFQENALLHYENDLVELSGTDKSTTYTVPKQVAQSLWLDQGFTQEWLVIDSVLIGRLVPDDPDDIAQFVDSTYPATTE